MNNKRKPRKEKVKKLDLLKPVTIEEIGTEEDPCFGKLYDITTSECQRCGDCEVCSIVMGQKNHLKRQSESKSNNFKDTEDIKEVGKKEVRKMIVSRILELVEQSGKKGIPYDKIFGDLRGSYCKFGFSLTRLRTIISKTIRKHKLIQKDNRLWKK